MSYAPFRLDERLAREIVRRTMLIVDVNVNVMDAHGIIIASGDEARIGDLHEGALVALMQARVVDIDAAVTDRLHGVRPGINLPLRCDGRMAGVIGLTGEPESLRERGELVRMAAEMMLEQARLTDMLGRDTRLREELVLSLVRGDEAPAGLADWAQRLGIDLTMPRVAAVIEVDSSALGVDAAMDEIRRLQTLLTVPERNNLIATVSLSEIVVLKPVRLTSEGWNAAEHRERVFALLARMQAGSTLGVRIALGNFFEGPGALTRSYTTARTTLHIGKRRHPDQQAFFYEDLALPVLLDGLRSGWRAEELREPLTRLSAHEGDGPLCRTLRVWFAHDMRAGETAQALHIHRNTLDYRLARIGELTGLDLARPDGLLRLYLALHLQDGGSGE
ncbi:MAG: sugar diacid recognition domain-containing protein [Rhodocyclaceae bacterium]